MLQRPGWKDLKAVKEGNFYLNTAFMSGGLGKDDRCCLHGKMAVSGSDDRLRPRCNLHSVDEVSGI